MNIIKTGNRRPIKCCQCRFLYKAGHFCKNKTKIKMSFFGRVYRNNTKLANSLSHHIERKIREVLDDSMI